MALRYFCPELPASRDLELDIWREANLVEAYATSRQGLALAAHRRGCRVRTQGNARSVELLEDLDLKISRKSRAVAAVLHADLKQRCRKSGIPDKVAGVRLVDLSRWLRRGWLPIILVDARLVGDSEVPHWVIVAELGPSMAVIQDPLARRGGTLVKRRDLARWLGFHGRSCAVVLEGRSDPMRYHIPESRLDG